MSGGIDIKNIIGLPEDVSVMRTWFESRELSSTKFITDDQSAAILGAVKADEWVSQGELFTGEMLLMVLTAERANVSDMYRKGQVTDETMKNFDSMVERGKNLFAKMEEAAEGYIAEQEGLQPPPQED